MLQAFEILALATILAGACVGGPSGPMGADITCGGVTCTAPNNGYAVCTDGGCSSRCNNPRRTICGGGCVDLSSSWGNCGTCGFACGSGESCVNAVCVCTNPAQCQE